MNNFENICPGCMEHSLADGVCPACGFNKHTYSVQPHILAPGTILGGKYLLGKMIGQGGFGITYIGLDINLNMRVAIKEYYPGGLVYRDVSSSDEVFVYDGDATTHFQDGKNKYIKEARTIAQFNDYDGIVSVKDFFSENGTAYIVMEFLDGESLKDYLIKQGGKISVSQTLDILKPILSALSQLHRHGLIHRDISPDNIMFTKSGKVKLIDFGAARDITGNKSLSIQLKPGYAPEEQYRTHGKQGSWTDIYALCATIYRTITGVVPVESNERIIKDTLALPSAYGIQIDSSVEAAIMKGLAVNADNRFSSVQDLYDIFYQGKTINNTDYSPTVAHTGQASYRNKPASSGNNTKTIIAVFLICISILILVFTSGIVLISRDSDTDSELTSVSTTVATSTPTVAPTATPTVTPTVDPGVRYRSSAKYRSGFEGLYRSEAIIDAHRFESLRSLIYDYNRLCTAYINNSDPSIFKYLQSGTTAYDQQVDWKGDCDATNAKQQYNFTNVIEGRYDGTYYYVWVDEELTVTDINGVSTIEEHWIYKILPVGSSYHIIDYTRDPLNPKIEK